MLTKSFDKLRQKIVHFLIIGVKKHAVSKCVGKSNKLNSTKKPNISAQFS
jgi:hypothetical protein